MRVADWDETENARVVGGDERRPRTREWLLVVGCHALDDLVQKVEHRLHALTNDSGAHSAVDAVVAVAAAVSVVAAPPLANDTALVFAAAEAAPGVEVPPPAVVAAGEDVPAVEPVAA
jgi:hypothetical protein